LPNYAHYQKALYHYLTQSRQVAKLFLFFTLRLSFTREILFEQKNGVFPKE
jgi:hypothetical protein